MVDAGMRQLRFEGFMPRVVRIACAAFLVEALRVPWQDGLQHFHEYLVDCDGCINANMWMNAGYVGLDPYYEGVHFDRRPSWDADGSYVRTWCPELCGLPDAAAGASVGRGDFLYAPWQATQEVLEAAGVTLGTDYPARCVDSSAQQSAFIQALVEIRRAWPTDFTDEHGRDVVEFRRRGGERLSVFTPKQAMPDIRNAYYLDRINNGKYR